MHQNGKNGKHSNGHHGNGNGSNGNGSNGGRVAANGRWPADRHRHVTVIGGGGFVGSVLVPRLLDRGYEVTILDAFIYGTDGLIDADHERLHLVRGDMRSVESLLSGCCNADAIVHLGGLVGDPSCAVDERLTLEINLEATAMIADTALGLGIPRLVFASSCAVYGDSDGLLTEESELAPVSTYARTKADSERGLMSVASDRFCPTALRFGTFYGLSPRPRFDLVVNLLTAKAVREGSISIFGGNQWRPFIHVEDGADSIIACLEAPLDATRGQIFNVGFEGENYTLREVGELIGSLVPGASVNLEPGSAQEANYRVSFEKIRRTLGFVPQRRLADGILEIKLALETEAIGDYREAKYDNHKSLRAGTAAALQTGLIAPAHGVPLR
jgi:nucleoside-diphosphate-sugar epimerase